MVRRIDQHPADCGASVSGIDLRLHQSRERFPASFTQSGSLKKIAIDHPPALEAIWFFMDEIGSWLSSNQGEDGYRCAWLERLAEAVLRDLKLVSISLEKDDDAQVIFETLNGRGAELTQQTRFARGCRLPHEAARTVSSDGLSIQYGSPTSIGLKPECDARLGTSAVEVTPMYLP